MANQGYLQGGKGATAKAHFDAKSKALSKKKVRDFAYYERKDRAWSAKAK